MPRLIKRNMNRKAKARKKLPKFLDELFQVTEETESYVETWGPGPWGIRLAEIGIHRKDGMGGATHFRNESGNALLFLRCEDLFHHWAYKVFRYSDGSDDEEFFKEQLREWAKPKRKRGR